MATEKLEIYKCAVCGNMVEMTQGGAGTLVCCNQPMDRIKENTTDAAQEKHVPVVTQSGNGIQVAVGSAAHPMTAEHLIEWIEAVVDGKVYREHLSPESAPEAFFPVEGSRITVRAYCNLHGLWKA